MYSEPCKGTDGCRPLGEIRPRTVCPYRGTAQADTGEQPERLGVQTVCGFAESVRADKAFYTPKEITDTIADVLADYSVHPSRVLEPSAGVGVFVDAVLRHSPNADVMAFEKDLLTGTILQQLHPDKRCA